MELSPAPPGLEAEYETLFTTDSLQFLHELISTFDEEVDQALRLRVSRKANLDISGDLPSFLEDTIHVRRDPAWRVLSVPLKLQRRHVDIGDLAPCDTQRFIKALKSPAQGTQVDFDDGNCPTYYNQIKGIHNVFKAVYNQFPGVEESIFDHSPTSVHVLTDVPHISQAPVLMLRPRAWNMVEHNMILGLPQGSIKATVLIENVLAAFEMEEILYELRDHSAGLNCGIWDYSASFVNKFGHKRAFLLPDRSKQKLLEIKAGIDGFMVYDLNLIEPMQKLFQLHTEGDNQLHQLRNDVTVTPDDLLSMPAGGVTLYGLKYNIAVGVLFINAWLSGKGYFFYKGQVEDSATAEISRSQVWQWIRHQTQLEDNNRVVSRQLVTDLIKEVMTELSALCHSVRLKQSLNTAADMFLEVVLKRDFPEFITTYLNQDHTFLSSHNTGQVEALNTNMHSAKL
ncbi:hypothetical protein PAMP_022881 [Pampus punctatissimus]